MSKWKGTADLSGKVALVTGASSGIGKETAIALAELGATVVCMSRNPEGAAQEIRERSGSTRVETVAADLGTIVGARTAAAAFLQHHKQLHILVNNAGTVNPARVVTQDGLEKTIALNHMGYYVLTHELLPLLRSCAPARIVSVASLGHRRAQLDVDDLAMEKGWDIMRAYGNSKLCNILFTTELAKQLEGTGVTANCLHPGGVRTNIWDQGGIAGKLVGILGWPFMITAPQGADTIIWLASSPECAGKTGGYWYKRKIDKTTAAARDTALAARLWAKSQELLDKAGT